MSNKYDKLNILTTIRDFIALTEAQIRVGRPEAHLDRYDLGRLQGLEDMEDYLNDLETDLMVEIDHRKSEYEYKHVAHSQFTCLKIAVVELMNEGWECYGAIEKERSAYQSQTEYSQIMRRRK